MDGIIGDSQARNEDAAKLTSSTRLLASLLMILGIILTAALALLDNRDSAIIGWALTVAIIVVFLTRPFRWAGMVVAIWASAMFALGQAYRVGMFSSQGLAERTVLKYVVTTALAIACFAAGALVANNLARRILKAEALLAHDAFIIEELTPKDLLTQTYKGSYGDKILTEELQRSQRYNRKLTLLLIGTDNWQYLVNWKGQEKANELLREIGKILVSGMRSVDKVIRYDEATFLLVLPETDVSGAQVVAERRCKEITAQATIPFRAGVAEFPGDAHTLDGLLSEAMAALDFARNASIDVASRNLLVRG